MEKEKTQVWFAGVSIDIELKRLHDAFPNLNIGDSFTDEDLEVIVELEKGSGRFKHVIKKWREECWDRNNLWIYRDRITGYHVSDDNERTDVSERKMREGVRRVKKSVKILHGTDKTKLTEENRRKYDHTATFCGSMLTALTAEKRKVKVLPPAASEANRILKKSDEDGENNV